MMELPCLLSWYQADHASSPKGEILAPARRRTARVVGRRSARLVSKYDPALGQVVRRHFDGHPVSVQGLDTIPLHPARGIGENLVIVVEANTEARFRQRLDDYAFELEQLFLRHSVPF